VPFLLNAGTIILFSVLQHAKVEFPTPN